MNTKTRKYRPALCPQCGNFRPAKVERDPGMRSAPWTVNRCVWGWQTWWDFDKERELVGTSSILCKGFVELMECPECGGTGVGKPRYGVPDGYPCLTCGGGTR